MNRVNRELNSASEIGLERVIEPLASYICATDQPKAALHVGPGRSRQRSVPHEQSGKRAYRCLLGESLVMKYMLLIYGDEHAATETEREHCYVESRSSRKTSIERAVSGRQPAASDVDSDQHSDARWKQLVTDGPFAETREQLGGYFLIEAKDLDEAIAHRSRIPASRWGTVEIRPVIEVAGLPTN